MVYKPRFTSMPLEYLQDGSSANYSAMNVSSGSSSSSNTTTVTLNGTNLSPAPVIDIDISHNFSGAGSDTYSVTRITLTGKILGGASSGSTGGAAGIFLNAGIDYNSNATLVINVCGTTKTWRNCKVSDVSYNRTQDNWAQSADYTITLETYGGSSAASSGASSGTSISSGSGGTIISASDSWSFEPIEDSFGSSYSYSASNTSSGTNLGPVNPGSSGSTWSTGSTRIRGSHRVSARAVNVANPSRAYITAKNWVCGKISSSSSSSGSSSGSNSAPSGYYNYYISTNYDIQEGSYEAIENWIEASEPYITEMSIEVSSDTSSVTTVRVQGQVQGLASGGNPTCTDHISGGNLYDNAVSGFGGTNYYAIANSFVSSTLNSSLVSSTVGHDVAKGIISYSYEYNDRPFFLSVTGTGIVLLSESVNLTDNRSADVFSENFVIGRNAGPVIQDLGTNTSPKRDLSVEAVVASKSGSLTFAVPSDLISAVDNLVREVHPTGATLGATFAKVSSDSTSWSPSEGRYSRSISWTHQKCNTGTTNTQN
jgi:hypothetical protein